MNFLNILGCNFLLLKEGRVVLAQQNEFIEMKNHSWGLT